MAETDRSAEETGSDGSRGGAAIDMPRPAALRHDALDALRGFALLGIFIINIIGFSIGISDLANPLLTGGSGAVNLGIWYFTTLFIEGSMRGLFSLMFGAGVILFTARAAYPDGPIRIADLHYRRTMWLILFGVIHGWVLLMPGDILFLYGVVGLFLFPLRLLTPKTLLLAAAAILALLTIFSWQTETRELAVGTEAIALEQAERSGETLTPDEKEVVAEWQDLYAGNWPSAEQRDAEIAARTGDLATLYATNAQWASWGSVWNLFLNILDAALLMLIGMALMKAGWLTGDRPARTYFRLALGGYAIGLTLRSWLLVERIEADFSPIVTLPWIFGDTARVALTIGHAGLFLLIWKGLRNGIVMRAFAAAGRMAFSNYIGQTILANLVFTSIGLGLYGQLDRLSTYGVLAAIFLFQIAFSLWWLARYRFGPLEWLWRTLTYGEKQPMRR
ncbi:MAG: DUF418 domain-containing protein [Parasphingopyxis sp.]|uniref:DUF418 domain-containing protein n=1 Tax=Parasphingopyxis sp. TaxID=1920299 RepID=UPI003FA186A5